MPSVNRKKSKIFSINDMNSNQVIELKDIKATSVDFFKAQFSMDQHNFEFSLVQKLIPSVVTEEYNNIIMGVPNEAEIIATVLI